MSAVVSVPSFTNSAMDGYAVRSEDAQSASDTWLSVTSVIQAGALHPMAIGPGEAARIMTGAPMPRGADAVVPQEETEREGDRVRVPNGVAANSCVRPAGLDFCAGQSLLDSGTLLGAAHIALLASAGISTISVFKQPVVAILATGDELVEPGQPLRPGQIYNSNAHGLRAAVLECGAKPVLLEPARDDLESLTKTLRELDGIDLLLTSGGVSVGDFDFVRAAVEQLGGLNLWRIRMRPGKPLMLGTIRSQHLSIPVLGLPGNPTSSMVTFQIFGKPAIRKLGGRTTVEPTPIRARTRDELDNRGGRETYFRVILSQEPDGFWAELSGGQDSSMLRPLAQANGLARVAFDRDTVEAGEEVDVFLLTDWTN